MFDNICSSGVSVASWKHSLTARLHSAHSMMGGVISLCSKENISVQKESARGPEKPSGLLIQAAWSKENNTQLCYSSGLFFFSSLVWTAGASLCVLRYLILTVRPLLCRNLHLHLPFPNRSLASERKWSPPLLFFASPTRESLKPSDELAQPAGVVVLMEDQIKPAGGRSIQVFYWGKIIPYCNNTDCENNCKVNWLRKQSLQASCL